MIKFGPSGNSESFLLEKHKGTEEAAKWCAERELDYYEYSFGRGVNLSEEKAISIGNAFKTYGVGLSVHAPYFINFATTEEEKAENSYNYVLNSAKMMRFMQGDRVIFHPASQGKLSRQVAVEKTIERLKVLRDKIYLLGYDDMKFCPETMGKLGQIGTIEEIVEFCKIDRCFVPTVDFGHVNARENGSLKTVKDFQDRLEYMIENLGMETMKNFHIHFSKIQYSAKGEIRHLTFEDEIYGPEFKPLAIALKNLNLEPVVICESAGTQAEDAKKMKDEYFSL
ncbi:MAG: TIM barrel protein [Clostridia bacterium]|nr:TIM barrel protein [Clostridia bacterium]